ncbi:hypothetical protein KCU83_g139, partial [Aureobasidium melanogenum]
MKNCLRISNPAPKPSAKVVWCYCTCTKQENRPQKKRRCTFQKIHLLEDLVTLPGYGNKIRIERTIRWV